MDNSIIKLYKCRVSNTQIFNDISMPTILHLEIPEDCVGLCIITFSNLDSLSEYCPPDILNMSGKWIDVESRHLDKAPGFHRYRIQGNKAGEMISLYFNYRVQSDNPEKPYIYMNRGGV